MKRTICTVGELSPGGAEDLAQALHGDPCLRRRIPGNGVELLGNMRVVVVERRRHRAREVHGLAALGLDRRDVGHVERRVLGLGVDDLEMISHGVLLPFRGRDPTSAG